MVGIVIVSHSAQLAEGLLQLANQMGQKKARIAAAGGIDDPDDPIGTDAMKILEAIQHVYSDDGVIVFMDMGSAILSTEMALEFLDDDQRSNIHLSDAPLAEGVISAAVTAGTGASLSAILTELDGVLNAKQAQLGSNTSDGQTSDKASATIARETAGELNDEGDTTPAAKTSNDSDFFTHTSSYVLQNTMGLHARPAAQLAGIAGDFDATAEIRNVSRKTGFASARSVNALMALQATQHHEINLRVGGKQAESLFNAFDALLRASFNESTEEFQQPDVITKPSDDSTAITSADGALSGIRVTRGIAIAPVFHYTNSLQEVAKATSRDPDKQKERVQEAVKQAKNDLQVLIEGRNHSISEEESEIFKAHKLIINDPELLSEVFQRIENESLEAAYAWHQVISSYINIYKNSKSRIMAERAADVLDAGQRVLSLITGNVVEKPNPTEPVILVTEELSPSDTASLDTNLVLGVICERGSDTSHSGILVRSLGIPAVFGVSGALSALRNGETCILDADHGKIHVNPADKLVAQMTKRRDNWLKTREKAGKVRHKQVNTPDGDPILVLANVSEPKHVEKAVDEGAEGIGLYRTEFLYMNRNEPPSEKEQYEVYRHALETMKNKPVTFRTIDVGGDKPVSYLSIEKEDNPFMGWRGIRFSLDQRGIFKTQLRALLRASAHGPAKIMFPMVATLQEFRLARTIVDEIKSELKEEGHPFNENIPLGIMVEVPSAAIRIHDFLPEIDFASIGTNDLTQYIMAADRMNMKVAALASYNYPAVTDLIAMVVKACKQENVEVSMCGEMARDTQVTAQLLELGLRIFSMSASGIPEFKLHLLRADTQG